MKTFLLSILFLFVTQAFPKNYFPLALNNTWTYCANSSSWSFFGGSTTYIYKENIVTIIDSKESGDTISYFRQTVQRTDSVIEITSVDFNRSIDTTVIRDTVLDTLKLFNNVVYNSKNRIYMKTQLVLGDTLVYDTASTGELSSGVTYINSQYSLIVSDTAHFKIGDSLHKVFVLHESSGVFTKSLYYCEGIGFVASFYNTGDNVLDAGFGGTTQITSYHINPSTSLEHRSLSSSLKIFTVHPNPFSSSIEIHASTPISFPIELKLFTINGQLVDNVSMSTKSFSWKPNRLSKGTYILSIKSKSLLESKRILFVE